MKNKLNNKNRYIVGVISDTHGIFRPDVKDAFHGVDLIIHAGDIGHPDVLTRLNKIAPVKAVRGNMDAGEWANKLPASDIIAVGNVSIYVLHDFNRLDLDPHRADIQAVVSGHTHRFSSEHKDGVLFINPGTAGPFKPPISVARLSIRGQSITPQFVEINI